MHFLKQNKLHKQTQTRPKDRRTDVNEKDVGPKTKQIQVNLDQFVLKKNVPIEWVN